MKNKIVLYKSPKGNIDLKVSFDGKTVWLSQKQMAELFNTDRTSIGRHIKNVVDTRELDVKSVSAKIAHTARDGKVYQVNKYNLDMIISVGYRVNLIKKLESQRFKDCHAQQSWARNDVWKKQQA